MASLNPGQVALFIIASVAALGVVIAWLRSWRTFAGYEELVSDVRRLSRSIRGDVFRDGSDVVVSGTYKDVPAVVRFSNAENTPGLNVRMPAATTFQLSVARPNAPVDQRGGVLVGTGDDKFDALFAIRTDRCTEAKLFLTPSMTSLLHKLACSSDTFLSIGSNEIELSELVIPSPNTGEHILQHLQAMWKLGEGLAAMPGADQVKLATLPRERHIAARVAIVVGAVVALASIFAAMKVPSRPAFSDVNATVAQGIPPSDALLLREAALWRVASADDFDPIAAAWLRNQGRTPSGRIPADFAGTGAANDVAYLLIGPQGRRRIAILANHRNDLDGEMVDVALIAVLPKSTIANIEWKSGKPPDDVLGDGLLVVQRHTDTQTAVVFFLTPSGLASGAPADYQQISLP